MLKIRTFILAITLTPLLAINWQQPSKSQTSPSLGTAGSMSGAPGPVNTSPSVGTGGSMSGGGTTSTSGNTISNPDPSVGTAGGQSGGGTTGSNGNTNSNPSVGNAGGQSGAGNGTGNSGNPDDNNNPSVGNAGGQSGAGNDGNNANNGGDTETANNGGDTGTENNGGDTETANNGGDTGTENNGGETDTGNNNEGNNDNPSGPVENLAPRASSIRIVRTPRGNIIRIKLEAQKQINDVALNILNSNNPGVLVALVQGGSTGQAASDNLINFLNSAGVNTDLGNNLREILSRIVSNQGNVDVDINQLNNAINTYNQIIQESSPVTLQTLAQNRDFVEIGNVLKELRKAVN